MVHQGLPDPLKRSAAAANRPRAALAVFLCGGSADGRGETWGLGGTQSSSFPLPRPSPLFSAVLVRAAAAEAAVTMAGAKAGRTSSTGAAATIGSLRIGAAARRVVASGCTAIHELLRSSRNVAEHARHRSMRTGGSGAIAAAAAAAAQALAPTLEAFVTLCSDIDGPGASTPGAASSWSLRTTSREAAAAADRDDGGKTAGGGDARSRVERRGGEKGGDRRSWRDAQEAVSLLLDLVDGFLETKEMAVSRGDGDTRAPHGRFQMQQQHRRQQQHPLRVGDDRLSSPSPWLHDQPQKGSVGANSVRRMWVEVRGLCGGKAEARAAASRRLTDLLKGTALSGGDGEFSSGAKASPSDRKVI